jgi:hypothetical protein
MTPAKPMPAPTAPARKTTAARTAASTPARPAAKASDKPADLAATPFLRFHLPKDLHRRLVTVLDLIDTADDATAHRASLAELAGELTAAGLDYYFLRSLKVAKVGFVTQQSANLGIAGVQQVMAPVIRNIVGRLEHAQLQSVAGTIRGLMV